MFSIGVLEKKCTDALRVMNFWAEPLAAKLRIKEQLTNLNIFWNCGLLGIIVAKGFSVVGTTTGHPSVDEGQVAFRKWTVGWHQFAVHFRQVNAVGELTIESNHLDALKGAEVQRSRRVGPAVARRASRFNQGKNVPAETYIFCFTRNLFRIQLVF
jgi:hypothetical protein